ncbi:MAG: hypothetical protein OHK005_11410 [Candidatus Methylacidiphilales bacterium]
MTPHIQILHLLDGARQASGTTVVLDVFRAFTVACTAFARGAAEILAVDSVAQARALHRDNPGSLLIGERGGLPPPGFTCGNSPSEIEALDLTGKTLVHTTSAGTRCLTAAPGADLLLAAAFVNVEATVQYILAHRPATVSIVCAGNAAESPATEDTACAEWIAARLRGQRPDFEPVLATLRTSLEAQRFLLPEKRIAPARDFDLCTELDRYALVLLATPLPDGSCRLQTAERLAAQPIPR